MTEFIAEGLLEDEMDEEDANQMTTALRNNGEMLGNETSDDDSDGDNAVKA